MFQNERSDRQVCSTGGKNVQCIRHVDHKIDVLYGACKYLNKNVYSLFEDDF